MTQVLQASLHHGPKYGGSAARRERLQSVLAYSCLGARQEHADEVACCNLCADWSGLDLFHVRCNTKQCEKQKPQCCRTLSSARSKGPNATLQGSVRTCDSEAGKQMPMC